MALYFRTTTTYSRLHPDDFAQQLSQHLSEFADAGEIAYKGSLDPQALRHGSLEVRHGRGIGGLDVVEAELSMHVLKDGSQLEADYRMAGKTRTGLMIVGLILLAWLNVQIFLRPENVSLLTAAVVPGTVLAIFIATTAGFFKMESNRLDKLVQKIVRGGVLNKDNTGPVHRQTQDPTTSDYPSKGQMAEPQGKPDDEDDDGEYDPTAAFRKGE
ncbi:MAG: hypothetical protein ACOCZ8_05885 [Bacteroidota bacterium]